MNNRNTTINDSNTEFASKEIKNKQELEEEFSDKISIEQAFDRCGGFGCFQFLSAFMNMIANAAAMFFFNAFAFLEVEPIFMCQLTPSSAEWTYGTPDSDL
jgi:hypothetical protein